MWLGRTRHLHFVGVGGIGMSGIAELLVNLGYRVSGSDLRRSETTDRLASLGLPVSKIGDVLNARNVTAPGGILETRARNVRIDATAEFKNTQEIGDLLVGTSSSGVPVRLRDIASISRRTITSR